MQTMYVPSLTASDGVVDDSSWILAMLKRTEKALQSSRVSVFLYEIKIYNRTEVSSLYQYSG